MSTIRPGWPCGKKGGVTGLGRLSGSALLPAPCFSDCKKHVPIPGRPSRPGITTLAQQSWTVCQGGHVPQCPLLTCKPMSCGVSQRCAFVSSMTSHKSKTSCRLPSTVPCTAGTVHETHHNIPSGPEPHAPKKRASESGKEKTQHTEIYKNCGAGKQKYGKLVK